MKKLPFAELTAVLEVSGSRAPAGAGDGCESEREDAPLRAQGAVTGLGGRRRCRRFEFPRTRRENTVQQQDATLPSGNLGPGPGRTWTRTC